MKKLITVCAMALVGFASFAMDFGFGLKGNLGYSLASNISDSTLKLLEDNETKPNVDGGFGIVMDFIFPCKDFDIVIQPEFNLNFNNGVGNNSHIVWQNDTFNVKNDSKIGVSVTTIDIPVLFGTTFKAGIFKVTPLIGPYISFPVAGTLNANGEKSDLKFSNPIFGLTGGVECGITAGPGLITFGGRYNFDLARTTMKVDGQSVEVYARRNISIDAGYKFIF